MGPGLGLLAPDWVSMLSQRTALRKYHPTHKPPMHRRLSSTAGHSWHSPLNLNIESRQSVHMRPAFVALHTGTPSWLHLPPIQTFPSHSNILVRNCGSGSDQNFGSAYGGAASLSANRAIPATTGGLIQPIRVQRYELKGSKSSSKGSTTAVYLDHCHRLCQRRQRLQDMAYTPSA